MVCPKCGGKTTVIDNVFNPETNEHYRKRRCLDCNYLCFTMEFVVEYTRQFDKEWYGHHRINTLKQKRKEKKQK